MWRCSIFNSRHQVCQGGFGGWTYATVAALVLSLGQSQGLYSVVKLTVLFVQMQLHWKGVTHCSRGRAVCCHSRVAEDTIEKLREASDEHLKCGSNFACGSQQSHAITLY